MLDDLYDQDKLSRSLFQNEKQQSSALMDTMDQLNKKYGRGTIFPAGMGIPKKRKWKMNQTRLSPSYLTEINDVLCVKK